MSLYRDQLPQLNNTLCITDGGMETTLVFHHQLELPEFASYVLLLTEQGRKTLNDYYRGYCDLARQYQRGLILETPTWRANPDWATKIGHSVDQLVNINLEAVRLIEALRREYPQDKNSPIIISGCIGPRGDGYQADTKMTSDQAEAYHRFQIGVFSDSAADMIAAYTLNYVEEAIGIARAAQQHKLPLCISFTVETDGKLPDGTPLQTAIEQVDQATWGYPSYYMINCAHPTHFSHLLNKAESWQQRLKGIRGNASCMSHAELDNAETLDEGNPQEFAQQSVALCQQNAAITVVGGCCGTDLRHIKAVCQQLAPSTGAS